MVKLVKANIRKDRTILIVFMLIITLSSMLLHTSLLITEYDNIYDDKASEYNVPDALSLVRTQEDINGAFDNAKGVKEYSVSDILYPSETKFSINDSSDVITNSGVIVYNTSDLGLAAEHNFIERDEQVSGKKIYMNLGLAKSNGIKTGDIIHIRTEGFGDPEFTVAGIYEDLMNGVSMSINSIMLEDDSYAEMKAHAFELYKTKDEQSLWKLVYIRCEDGCESKDALKEVRETMNARKIYSYGYTRELSRESFIGIISLLVPFLATFSLLMIIICIIMIIFAISNNINRDIKNIGALCAVGHTAGQVRTALVAEYLLIGTVSSIIGVSLSYVLFPILEKAYLRGLTGIVCEPGFKPMMSFGVMLGVIGVCVVTAYFTSAKIKKLHPATALRFGLASNSFKRNHFPIADTKGSLNFLLAAKSAVQSLGQSISILIVTTTVAFLTFFSIMLYYNTKLNTESFQRLLQGDVPDATFTISTKDENRRQEMLKKIKNVDGVTQAYSLTFCTTSIGGDDVDTIFTAEPDDLYCGVYEGKMCREANEAVIGGVLAERLGLKVGDEFTLSNNEKSAKFLVTGLQQAIYSLGERVYITDEGLKRIGIDPVHPAIRVRINEPNDDKVDKVIEQIKAILGDECTATENYYRFQHSEDNLPVFAAGMIIAIFILLNFITVFLIIRLLLKTVFIKREQEFGIKKAVGFTSKQLRLQLSLSMLIPATAAAVIGAVLGYILVNPLFNVVFNGYGIKNSDLIVKPIMILITSVIVLILVFVLSFIMSRKMKKVSAYKLINE